MTRRMAFEDLLNARRDRVCRLPAAVSRSTMTHVLDLGCGDGGDLDRTRPRRRARSRPSTLAPDEFAAAEVYAARPRDRQPDVRRGRRDAAGLRGRDVRRLLLPLAARGGHRTPPTCLPRCGGCCRPGRVRRRRLDGVRRPDPRRARKWTCCVGRTASGSSCGSLAGADPFLGRELRRLVGEAGLRRGRGDDARRSATERRRWCGSSPRVEQRSAGTTSSLPRPSRPARDGRRGGRDGRGVGRRGASRRRRTRRSPGAGRSGASRWTLTTGDEASRVVSSRSSWPVLRGSATSRGCSSMVELQLPKLRVRVRFPSPAPTAARLASLGSHGSSGSRHAADQRADACFGPARRRTQGKGALR